ncbi:methionyl-tRNA formyltransferase [Corynebacterium pseudogenitalium]|uniref:methionyl-tRNA formyltransferase n=1 Tax=Corynebacterium pseudogenitalium TaxID=38303 RepID=UPI00210A1326|nr:methionyl-tRNA formyltransferase [Corynebacterium pseudogenitalium]UUA86370.1 methionyl-tRNA formyltransferase [Corynebacterium pseudogenitalium]
MRIVFAGTPEPAVVALEALLHSEHEVVAVLTRPDAPKGRGRTLHPSPVKKVALEHGIEVLEPKTLRGNAEIVERLRAIAPDAIPVVAYGNLVPPELLDLPQHGWVNLHFSLLPELRGAAPVQAAILSGLTTTGATTFRIDEGLDTGPVLATFEEAILPTDTADDLLTRLAYKGADLLVATMDGLASGSIVPEPQPMDGTYAPKIQSKDARIQWDCDAEVVDRTIRAYTPGPGAWTMLGEQRVKIGPVSIGDSDTLGAGEVAVEKNRVRVGTGTVDVILQEIQPPGKKRMAADAWGRGLATETIEAGVKFV